MHLLSHRRFVNFMAAARVSPIALRATRTAGGCVAPRPAVPELGIPPPIAMLNLPLEYKMVRMIALEIDE